MKSSVDYKSKIIKNGTRNLLRSSRNQHGLRVSYHNHPSGGLVLVFLTITPELLGLIFRSTIPCEPSFLASFLTQRSLLSPSPSWLMLLSKAHASAKHLVTTALLILFNPVLFTWTTISCMVCCL